MAAFNQTQVQLDILQQAAQQVHTVKDSIASQLLVLQHEVESTITNKSLLNGDFATVVNDVHVRWTADSQKLTTALQNIADLLLQNHAKYHYTNQTQTQVMSAVRSRLNP
jgi:uncharacterized protein YukE